MTTEAGAGPRGPQAAGGGHGGRSKRLSKRVLRTLAWVAGGVSLAAPWAALAAQPKPAAAPPPPARQVIIRKIIRHVYTQAPVKTQPKIRYVYAPAAAQPVAKTSGSHP